MRSLCSATKAQRNSTGVQHTSLDTGEEEEEEDRNFSFLLIDTKIKTHR